MLEEHKVNHSLLGGFPFPWGPVRAGDRGQQDHWASSLISGLTSAETFQFPSAQSLSRPLLPQKGLWVQLSLLWLSSTEGPEEFGDPSTWEAV